MLKILSNSVLYILKFFSYSPIFTCSDDDNFGEINKNSSKIRYSLCSFKIGSNAFYFISYRKNEKFKFFLKLNLSELLDSQNTDSDIDSRCTTFESKIYSLSNDEPSTNTDNLLDTFNENLTYKHSQIDQSINKTFNKFLAYIAIIAFIFPIFSNYLKDILPFQKKEMYINIFTIIICYLTLNIFKLFYDFIKIKTIKRAALTHVTNHNNSLIAKKYLSSTYYYDYLFKIKESTLQVSVIKNLEKYILLLIISSILFIIFYNLLNQFPQLSKNSLEYIKNSFSIVKQIFSK